MVAAQTAVVLDCSLNIPNVKVSFFRQSKKGALFQLPVKAGRYEVLGEQQLLIRSVSIDDIGMYVCKAEGVEDKKTSIFITPGKIIFIFHHKSVCCMYETQLFAEMVKLFATTCNN